MADVMGAPQEVQDAATAESVRKPPSKEPEKSGWGLGIGGTAWGGWVDSLVDTVKKQTDVVTSVLERDISEFISVVAPPATKDSVVDGADAAELPSQLVQEQPPTPGETTWRFDPETATLHADSVDFKNYPDNDHILAPNVTKVVESTLSGINRLVGQADQLLDSAESYLENVDVTDTVTKMEKLADKAEDFLESVEKGVWGLMSSAITMGKDGLQGLAAGAMAGVQGGGKSSTGSKPNIMRTAAILALRHDEGTFTVNPADDAELAPRFKTFSDTFDLTTMNLQIARILEDDSIARSLMTKFVPSTVGYDEFWKRYFFRVSEVEREEELRKRVMNDASSAEEDEFEWDDESSEEGESVAKGVSEGQPKPEAATAPDDTPKRPKPPAPVVVEDLNSTQSVGANDDAATGTKAELPHQKTVEVLRKSSEPNGVSESEKSYDIVSEKGAGELTSESESSISITPASDSAIKEETFGMKEGGEEGGGDWDTWE